MALPKSWFEHDEPQGDLNDEKRVAKHQPYIVHRSVQDEEHLVEVRDEVRMSGTMWAVLGSWLLAFALMCLIFVGQELRGGRYLMTTFFWSSLVLGCGFLVFGLLRKRTRV